MVAPTKKALNFLDIITLTGTILGILTLLVIGVRQKENPYRKTLLMLFLLSTSYYSFMVYLVHSGQLVNYPHFFRTGSPFLYLIPISLMLFARAVARNQKAPRWQDLAWLAIPVLHLIELLPFYLQGAAVKLQFLKGLNVNRDLVFYGHKSWIPSIWHYYIQGILIIALLTYTFWKTLRPSRNKDNKENRLLLIWTNRIALFLGLCFAASLILLIQDAGSGKVQEFVSLFFGIALISVFLFFFLTPEILYSKTGAPVQRTSQSQRAKEPEFPREQAQAFKDLVEKFFTEESDFLHPDFRLQDLAVQLSLNRNTLSYLINKIYGKNFNQLLNEKRVEIVLHKIGCPEWENLSLHGIAQEVGFRSRTTFNKAFKKKTGYTFSEYRAESTDI